MAEETKQLTGADSIRVNALTVVDGEDASDVEMVRLAMLIHGERPQNDQRITEILDMPVKDYLAYIKEARDQSNESPKPVYHDDGSATVGEYEIRPMVGRDLRLLATDATKCMAAMTGLSNQKIRKLPIGIYSQLLSSVAFLAEKAL